MYEERAAASQINATSAISQSLRNQRRAMNVGVAIALLWMIAGLTAYVAFGRSIGDDFEIGWLWLLILFPAVALVAQALQRRRMRRIEELVPALGGMVCPKCVRAVERSGDDVMRCGTCQRRYSAGELRTYWDMSVTEPMAALRLWRSMQQRQVSRRNLRGVKALLLRRHGNPVWMCVSLAAMFMGMGAVFSAVTGGSIIAGSLTYVHMVPLMIGFFLLMTGWKHRAGPASFCAACGYQRTPGETADSCSCCPECAGNWNEVGGTRHGEANRRPGYIAAGATLAALGLVLVLNPLMLGNWKAMVLPTSSLIQEASRPHGSFLMDEWAELNGRTLSEAETIELAEALLAKRLGKSYSDREDEKWLTAQIAANALPGELVARYYAEALDVWIIGSSAARVGETMKLEIGTHYRGGGLAGSPQPVALISGFFVGDDPTPNGRQIQGIPGVMFGHVRLQYGGEDVGPGNGPSHTLTPNAPGTVRVRLALWLAHLPQPGNVAITWNNDGTPVAPAGAVWMEQRVIEHVIEVSE